MDKWLRAITDPQEIERAKEAVRARQTEKLAAIFAVLKDHSYIDSELIELLERDRAANLQKLKSLLPAQGITAESIGAAALLLRFHDDEGRTFAARVLQKGSLKERSRLLGSLDSGLYDDSKANSYRQFLFADPQLIAGLLAQLDDPDQQQVKTAIQTCGYLGVPGVNEHFLEMLRRPDVPDKGRLLFWLSRGEVNDELFDYVVATAGDFKPDDHWGTAIFEACAKSNTATLRTKAKLELRKILTAWPDDGKRGYHGNRLSVLSTLAETAEESDVGWLLELAEQERGLYAASPLGAYVKLRPAAGRALLVSWLKDQDKERQRAAISTVSENFKGTAEAEMIEALASQAAKSSGSQLEAICTALESIGGDAAYATIEKYGKKLPAATLEQFRGSQDPTSLAELAAAVRAAGVLTEQEVQKVLDEYQRDDSKQDEDQPSRQPRLFDFLYVAGAALTFDAETDMLPCRHDQLIEQFARASRGRFVPEAVLEEWHRKSDDDFEAGYTVQYVAGGRLFRAEIRNFGDWYDVERIVLMINASLAEQKVPERFVGLAAEGQMPLFVFAEPAKIQPLARQFHMTLSDDYNSAMRQGIEFEEKVRERYSD